MKFENLDYLILLESKNIMFLERKTILYFSGLDKTVTEGMIANLFIEYPISYVKIPKSHLTKEPYGYGFLGFKSLDTAENAFNRLNYTKVGKRTLRLAWYNRDPNSARNCPGNNVYVKKLDIGTTHREFHDYFSQFGQVLSAKLQEDEEGENVGFGFVLFANEEEAKKAITEGNSTVWKGRRIFVGPFIKKKPRAELSFNTIYVKNIAKVNFLFYFLGL